MTGYMNTHENSQGLTGITNESSYIDLGVYYSEEQVRALQERAWDAGFEAAEWADKLRRWQQPVTVENPYRRED